MYLIETKDLCKKYSGQLVIDHVNMHVPENSIYGFVGENGSGKTTIMRLITGLAELTSGSYEVFGVKNTSPDIYKVRRDISALVEAASLIPTMTAIDNMIYQELYLGIKLTKEERMELLKKVHLENVGNKKVKNYSLGMRQRLGIALALLSKPKMMLLDEPLNGLDPEGIAELRELLIELNQNEGITILISSHILSELEKVASTYGFISHGRLIEEISSEELHFRCRKSLTIFVDDVKKADALLKKMKIKEYDVNTNGEVRIFDSVDIAETVIKFHGAKINIVGINSSEGTVEDYYLDLIKGGE